MEESETSFLIPEHLKHLYQQIKSHDRRRSSEKRKKMKRPHDPGSKGKADAEGDDSQP